MKFHKYKSIDLIDQPDYLTKLQDQGRLEGRFIVQEKVHGANFSLWYNGQDLWSAKRSGPLPADNNFHSSPQIMEKYRSAMEKLYARIAADHPVETIAVYGEIFGGDYHHPDLPSTQVKPVQRGVYYCPHIDFFAFDIRADHQYLTVSAATKLYEECGFFGAQTLFSGTYQECRDYPNDIDSTIPARFELPPITPNVVEGVVIRSDGEGFFDTEMRVILKNKNEKWVEKAKAMFKEVRELELSEEAKELLAELLSYVTENRLRNVLSKTGPIGPRDFGLLMKEINQDVWKDYNPTFGERYKALEKVEQKKMSKQLNQRASEIIKPNFIAIQNGEF